MGKIFRLAEERDVRIDVKWQKRQNKRVPEKYKNPAIFKYMLIHSNDNLK